MKITTFTLGRLETNCYVLSEGGRAVAVDAGENPAPMIEYVRKDGLDLTHVFNTHLHFDHICGNASLTQATGAVILANPADAYLRKLAVGRGGSGGAPPVPSFDFEPLALGRREVLGQPMIVLDTPGHTPGSLSFFFPRQEAVFVGDLLFRGSVGRTYFAGGDAKVVLESIRRRIFTLPGDATVYPGHGPATLVSFEKEHNPFFKGGLTSSLHMGRMYCA
jgi:glyoxylase-like metal-dependent hydrolase (beta-lactamase superfamily II)